MTVRAGSRAARQRRSHGQQPPQLLAVGQGPAEEAASHRVAADLAQAVDLAGALDALGDQGDPERAAEATTASMIRRFAPASPMSCTKDRSSFRACTGTPRRLASDE